MTKTTPKAGGPKSQTGGSDRRGAPVVQSVCVCNTHTQTTGTPATGERCDPGDSGPPTSEPAPESWLLRLRPLPNWRGIPGIIRLRTALKRLLRDHGLRAVEVRADSWPDSRNCTT